jgi:3-oxoacyl-[acyl-carrier protein] reductase
MALGEGRRVALVTGAGSGIGAATAEQLATKGCDVVINYAHNRDGAEAVAARCMAFGGAAMVLQADIASDVECRGLVAETVGRFGRLDVLVNNAGVTRHVPARDLEALNLADFERVFAVNVVGSYQMARAAAPHLARSDAGAIVNVSSDSGMTGDGSSFAYAASKGALNTLTLGLARSLAPTIRVNAVCPGFADTGWALAWQDDATYARFRETVKSLAPLKVIPSPADIAEAICWLALGARAITGQLIVIDGGTSLTARSPLAADPR